MRCKKPVFLFFLFLFSLVSMGLVSGATDNITGYTFTDIEYNESFPYSNNFASHGWSYSNGGCGFDDTTPILSPFSTNAWGYNRTNPCAFAYTRFIRRNLATPIDSGSALIVFNLTEINESDALGTSNSIVIANATAASPNIIFHARFTNTSNLEVQNSLPGGFSCNITDGIPIGFSGEIVIEIDIDNLQYSYYINRSSSGCFDQVLSTSDSLRVGSIELDQSVQNGEFFRSYIDDLIIGTGTVDEIEPDFCTDPDSNDFNTTSTVNATAGLFTDFCSHNVTGNYTDQTVVEYTCTGSVVTNETKDCNDFGFNCFNGACTSANQRPTITNLEDFKIFHPFVGVVAYQNQIRYKNETNITYNVTAIDNEGEPIFVAVDCDISGLPGVGGYLSGTYAGNCTYPEFGLYTARIYATDFSHLDYLSFLDINVTIVECESPSDCDAGFTCNATGFCVEATNITFCTDTDSGNDANVSGVLTTDFVVRNDTCSDFDTIFEYQCDNSSPVGYSLTPIDCGVGRYCFNNVSGGAFCRNQTGLIAFTLYVNDFDTSDSLAGIEYILLDLNTSDLFTGTITTSETIAINAGNTYLLNLDDPAEVYKDYFQGNFVPSNEYFAFMDAHCTGDCVFFDDFSYGDSPYHHGWAGAFVHETVFDSSLGFLLQMNLSENLDFISQRFPESDNNVVTVLFDVIMADGTPADGQDIYISIEEQGGNDIVLLRFVVDETGGNKMYRWLSGSFAELIMPLPFTATDPFRIKVVINYGTNTYDVFFDRLATGDFVKLADNAAILLDADVGSIRITPVASPNDRTAFINNIDISQAASEEAVPEAGSPTSPASSDTDSPWFRDAAGDLKFDRTKCDGYKSIIVCAGVKYFVKTLANGVAWLFTGIHILYLVVVLLLFILLAPIIIRLMGR